MNSSDLRFFKLLIERGKFIFIRSDKDFIVEDVNPYFTELTGYKREEILGKNSLEVLDPPGIREKVEYVLNKLRHGEGFEINENPIFTKNGEIKHILWYNVWDEENQKNISIGIDITDLREVQENLRRKDEYLIQLTNEAGAYLWRTLISPDGKEKTVYYTDSIEKILGYKKEILLDDEFVPHDEAFFRKIIYPEDYKEFSEDVENTLKKGKSVRKELRLIRKDGKIIWVYDFMKPIMVDNEIKEVIGIGIDITEKKEKELVLEEKNKEFEFLLDAINAYVFKGIYHKKEKVFHLLYYSKSVEKVTGYSLEEFESGKITWENIIYPPDREMHRKDVEDKVFKGMYATLEYRIIKRDGSIIWVLDSLQPMVREDGDIEVMGLCLDITERKRLEEKIRAIEKLKTLGLIGGGIAHVFNNILTGVLGYSSLLRLKLLPSTPEYLLLLRIEEGIEKMVDVNKKLLEYANIEKYRGETKGIIDINDIIKTVVKDIKSKRKGDFNISLSLDDKICKIEGDEDQIKMALEFIVSNSLGLLPDNGGINISTSMVSDLELEKKGLDIAPGRYVKIIFKDDGLPIVRDGFEGIFDPFSFPESVLSKEGITFPTIYGIIKSHEGTIYVDSKTPRGNEIIIYFPCR